MFKFCPAESNVPISSKYEKCDGRTDILNAYFGRPVPATDTTYKYIAVAESKTQQPENKPLVVYEKTSKPWIQIAIISIIINVIILVLILLYVFGIITHQDQATYVVRETTAYNEEEIEMNNNGALLPLKNNEY